MAVGILAASALKGVFYGFLIGAIEEYSKKLLLIFMLAISVMAIVMFASHGGPQKVYSDWTVWHWAGMFIGFFVGDFFGKDLVREALG